MDMAGWFKALLQKPRKRPDASNGIPGCSPSSTSPPSQKSPASLPRSLTGSPKLGPSISRIVSSSDSARWSKLYDVCICHSEGDLEFVEELVTYLENQPEHFRCFLQLRDSAPGGAVMTELCNAVQNSHCWVLLITPNFLKDPWCCYQMHHALTEAPMANGRTIPVLKDIDRTDYPRELRCIYYISVVLQENSFRQIKETILRYLLDLCQNPRSND
ncbi:toll/interleukin-1 receptor domain-containing adapter protein [Crotalus adamanteus]|uniref:Toll/interleukin-1 receptor domain-containing adapter protein n=1 Tax=Crotalus adamanteus TaxID=8729 RepID=A0AAW1AZ54_CROAD